jgi:hypothetical protein
VESEYRFYSFLTSALNVSGQLYAPAALSPVFIGQNVGWDLSERSTEKQKLASAGNQTLISQSSSPQLCHGINQLSGVRLSLISFLIAMTDDSS